jgi:hypothetical protein
MSSKRPSGAEFRKRKQLKEEECKNVSTVVSGQNG